MTSIPDEFICPITFEIMKEPVICEDGYTYDKSAIMSIQNSLSPITRQPINKTKLIPNRALKSMIDRFLLSNPQYQNNIKEKERLEQIEKEEFEQIEKEQRDKELYRLREEQYLKDKNERTRVWLQYEEDQRKDRLIRLEKLEQERIRNEEYKKRQYFKI